MPTKDPSDSDGAAVRSSQQSQSQDSEENLSPKEASCKSCKKTDCFTENHKGHKIKSNSKWIACDMCKGWFHGLCQSLQNPEVITIVKLDKKEYNGSVTPA